MPYNRTLSRGGLKYGVVVGFRIQTYNRNIFLSDCMEILQISTAVREKIV